MKPILELKEIDKSFTGVHALDKVSFCCYPGTVHILQGENGAGKSTLLKIISGLYQPDSGEIYLNGEKVTFHHPMDSRKHGIAMVYQEMTILPHLTIAQNIFLNQESRLGGGKHGLLNEYALVEKTRALAAKYNIEIDPYATAGDIPISQQQIVEILKALSSDPKILILDEPTSTLTRTEVDQAVQHCGGAQAAGLHHFVHLPPYGRSAPVRRRYDRFERRKVRGLCQGQGCDGGRYHYHDGRPQAGGHLPAQAPANLRRGYFPRGGHLRPHQGP